MQRRKYTRADLNENQNAFVDAYVAAGGDRLAATRAVQQIYGYDSRTASITANRMLKNEKIRDVLTEETFTAFAAGAVTAYERLIEILTTGMWFGQAVKPADGIKAITSVLDRAGLSIAHKMTVDVNHNNLSPKELRAEIAGMLAELPEGDRAAFAKSLGYEPGEVIDVEAVSIDPAAPWGRKEDGTPKKKPGNKTGNVPGKGITKRYLPGPDAVKPDTRSEVEKVRERMMQRKLREARGEQDD